MKKNKGTKAFQKLEEEYARHLFGDIQCDRCRHYIKGPKCKAFDEIPFDILDGSHDHRKPYPGDNGILFEPKKE